MVAPRFITKTPAAAAIQTLVPTRQPKKEDRFLSLKGHWDPEDDGDMDGDGGVELTLSAPRVGESKTASSNPVDGEKPGRLEGLGRLLLETDVSNMIWLDPASDVALPRDNGISYLLRVKISNPSSVFLDLVREALKRHPAKDRFRL